MRRLRNQLGSLSSSLSSTDAGRPQPSTSAAAAAARDSRGPGGGREALALGGLTAGLPAASNGGADEVSSTQGARIARVLVGVMFKERGGPDQ